MVHLPNIKLRTTHTITYPSKQTVNQISMPPTRYFKPPQTPHSPHPRKGLKNERQRERSDMKKNCFRYLGKRACRITCTGWVLMKELRLQGRAGGQGARFGKTSQRDTSDLICRKPEIHPPPPLPTTSLFKPCKTSDE